MDAFKLAGRRARADTVNQLIDTIGGCGRGFFHSRGPHGLARAFMEVDDNGRVWFYDDYTKKKVYTHYSGRWKYFSHGGTLRELVISFRKFIQNGRPIWAGHFGPWSESCCGGDLWGYGEAMEQIRQSAKDLRIIR